MNQNDDARKRRAGWTTMTGAMTAVTAFHLAFTFPPLHFLIFAYLVGLLLLTRASSNRLAFYLGFGVGLAAYGPQLAFFWHIFGPAAFALWAILAFWIGLFVLLARLSRERLGDLGLALLAPFLWTGLEYFRSELYYLRFSWLSAGFVFSDSPQLARFMRLGVYGIGFALMGLAAWTIYLPRKAAWMSGAVLALLLAGASNWPVEELTVTDRAPARTLYIAGIQAEFPAELEAPLLLSKLLRKKPRVNLIVMSEYTFDGPVPVTVKNWCRKHQRYLIVGGKEPAGPGEFLNMAYVVGPSGRIVFRQAKSVPIQFFKDGLPAPAQRLWNSPWGKLGICICYDLSYRRVVDHLIKLGAQAIIVPTMDMEEWGEREHRLHARVAPIRASEYQVPVFRLASSGISQWVDSCGIVRAVGPYPGPHTVLGGILTLPETGRMPMDRWLHPLAVGMTGGLMLWLLGFHFRGWILMGCIGAERRLV